MRLAILLLLASAAHATTLRVGTVCSPSCDRAYLEDAINDAVLDCAVDVIEMTAGETFEPGPTANTTTIKYRPCTTPLWIRSSRWKELPPVGYRVFDGAHNHLMPTLLPHTSGSVSIIRFGYSEAYFYALNATTNVVTMNIFGPHTAPMAVGDAIVCGAGSTELMPTPLTEGITLFVLTRTPTGGPATLHDFTFSLTKGGATLDITDTIGMPGVDGSGAPRCQPVNNARNVRVTGLRFMPSTGVYQGEILVMIGGEEKTRETAVRDIWLDRIIISGYPDQNGPKNSTWLNGSNITLSDSWIGHTKAYSDATQAVSMATAPGPITIKNNYIMAASGNVFTGGQSPSIWDQLATNVTIEGNHIEKAAYMNFHFTAGAPSGACYYANGYGARWENTSVATTNCTGGGCYRCQSNGTWIEDTTLVFRGDDYLPKASIEFKNCVNCRVEGNLIEGNFASSDTGVVACFETIQNEQGRHGGTANANNNVLFRNNWCKNVWAGIFLTSAGAPWVLQTDQRAENNLITGMQWPQLSMLSPKQDAKSRSLRMYSYINGVAFNKITVRPDPTSGYSGYGMIIQGQAVQNTGGEWRNTILAVHDAGSNSATPMTCDGGGGAGCDYNFCSTVNGLGRYIDVAGPPYRMTNLLMFGTIATFGSQTGGPCFGSTDATVTTDAGVGFVGADTTVLMNNQLAITSPYNAGYAGTPTLLNTDGTTLGADIEELSEAISGAQAGTPKWTDIAKLKITPGSTRALVSYTSPIDSTCAVVLYTSHVRLVANEHDDTPTDGAPGPYLDNRAGNINDGRRRVFVLGTNAALTASTPYWVKVTCDTNVAIRHFRTQAAGSATTAAFQLADSVAYDIVVEYSASPDMSSPTTTAAVLFASSRAAIAFPVDPGVRFARWKTRTSGAVVLRTWPVQAFITR